MFIRTGLLLFYLMVATRTLTKISDNADAAHQETRQFCTFTAVPDFDESYCRIHQGVAGRLSGTVH